jgi:hypothetical protein
LNVAYFENNCQDFHEDITKLKTTYSSTNTKVLHHLLTVGRAIKNATDVYIRSKKILDPNFVRSRKRIRPSETRSIDETVAENPILIMNGKEEPTDNKRIRVASGGKIIMEIDTGQNWCSSHTSGEIPEVRKSLLTYDILARAIAMEVSELLSNDDHSNIY